MCQHLVKMEKALNLQVKDGNRKPVLTDSSVLRPKALGLHEDFSKGIAEVSASKPFTAHKGWLHRFGNTLGLKKYKNYWRSCTC